MEKLEVVSRMICEERCHYTHACDHLEGDTKAARCHLWTNRKRLAKRIIAVVEPPPVEDTDAE